MLLRKVHANGGFYIGQDGFLTVTPDFITVMLRLDQHHIVSALLTDDQVTAVVDGVGQVSAALIQAKDKPRQVRPSEKLADLNELAARFAQCEVTFTAEGAVLRLGDAAFPLSLAAPIDKDVLFAPEPIDDSLSLVERMRRWNRGIYYGWDGDTALRAWVSDGRYDMNWGLSLREGFIYCRLGVSGYCDKGWAMRSTAVLRAHEVRMLADHLDALLPYHPIEECFVADGCAFPDDGGWYWSVREATQDQIRLNGCGGDTYIIFRPR